MILEREMAAAGLFNDSEDDWEDIDEEPFDENDTRDFIMKGKRVSLNDIANMFEFAMRSQLMMDKSRLRFYLETKNIKSGKVNLPKSILWHRCRPGSNLAHLSGDRTRWSSRLIKQGQYNKSILIPASQFARLVLRNLFADKKVKLYRKNVKAVIK